MTVFGAMMGGRRAALLLMTDTCTVGRPGAAASTIDMSTGLPTVPTPTPIYTGQFRLHANRIQNPSPQGVAGSFPITQDFTAAFPATAPLIEVRDIITVTASQFHARDVGLRFRVMSIDPISQSTAQRCQVEVITG